MSIYLIDFTTIMFETNILFVSQVYDIVKIDFTK